MWLRRGAHWPRTLKSRWDSTQPDTLCKLIQYSESERKQLLPACVILADLKEHLDTHKEQNSFCSKTRERLNSKHSPTQLLPFSHYQQLIIPWQTWLPDQCLPVPHLLPNCLIPMRTFLVCIPYFATIPNLFSMLWSPNWLTAVRLLGHCSWCQPCWPNLFQPLYDPLCFCAKIFSSTGQAIPTQKHPMPSLLFWEPAILYLSIKVELSLSPFLFQVLQLNRTTLLLAHSSALFLMCLNHTLKSRGSVMFSGPKSRKPCHQAMSQSLAIVS